MKIVEITKLYPPHVGGVEVHVSQIATIFSTMGNDVTVLTSQLSADQLLSEDIDEIHIVRRPIRYFENKLQTWRWILSQWRIFRNADIVHVHDVAWWLIPVLPIIRKKLCITFHGWEAVWPIPWQHKLQRFLFALIAKETIHIGSWIQEFYWDYPSLVMYGGVSLGSEHSIMGFPKKNEPLHICFLGRLSEENEIFIYLKLFDLLKEKWHSGIKITWIGDGPLRTMCEEVGDVTGMVDFPEKYVAGNHLVCTASYLSMLLAQALGKVVVSAYDTPLKRRYIETYPLADALIHGGSHHELYHKLFEKMSNKKNWSAMENTAREKAADFTWLEIAKKYADLWQDFGK